VRRRRDVTGSLVGWMGLAGLTLGVSILTWSVFGASELVVAGAAILVYGAARFTMFLARRVKGRRS
jgi:hypothetical protein